MKALLLAAGRGERLRPLTDETPKPLVGVGGKPLIVWHIERLRAAGIRDLVINTSWLAQQIHTTLGDGAAWGVQIRYSDEQPAPYETGGGIATALPLLGEEPFLVISADIWTDFDYRQLPTLKEEVLAHLWLVPNPDFHPTGDFSLRDGRIGRSEPRLTFANIGLYRPALFKNVAARQWIKLASLLDAAIAAGRVTGDYFPGRWHNIGTLAQLEALRTSLLQQPL